jgi:DNA-binding transcriptional LysR family regulator
VELRHLQYFVSVATTGGFGRAARALHVSQSAISEQIRDLEEEVGAPLIDRTERQIRLTREGELFLEGARATLAASERAVESVQRSISGEEGKLAIGFFVGGNGRYFPRLIRAFRQQYPRVKVSLVEMVPSDQWQALQNGTLDIGFTRPIQGIHSGVRAEKLYSERLYIVLPKDHRLAKRKHITLGELREERFVMTERPTSPAVSDRIIALCNEAGFSPRISTTATVSSGVIALVEAGEGIGVLPDGSRYLGAGEVVFVPLLGAGAQVDLVIAWSAQRAGAVHRSFLQLARRFRSGE